MKTREDYIRFAEANQGRLAYRRKMDSIFTNGWGVNDLANWLCQQKTGKGLEYLQKDYIPGEESLPPAEQLQREIGSPDVDPVERRMVQYRNIFSADTPNDEMMLRHLAQFEVNIELLFDKAKKLIESGRITSKDLDSVVMMTTKMSSECRLIQRDLGIDKPSRGEGQDAGMKLVDYVNQAKKVLHKQSIPIGCPNCYASESKIRNLFGFIVWHLADVVKWEFKYECPRCHSEVGVTPDLAQDFRQMFEWV